MEIDRLVMTTKVDGMWEVGGECSTHLAGEEGGDFGL